MNGFWQTLRRKRAVLLSLCGVLALCVLSVALMVWRHKANLLRLKNGTESRFYFGHKEEAASGDETMAEAEPSGKMEREHLA